jgi:hypothetical protein
MLFLFCALCSTLCCSAQLLPLKVTTFTEGPVLRGRDAVTVVFSRSVIALGSDFGAKSSAVVTTLPTEAQAVASNLPLYATASGARQPVPGKLRWVTTYIVRFDPDIDWPLDLVFDIVINSELKAWDGTVLTQAKEYASRHFNTDQLRGGGWASASSKKAAQLTDNRWDSTVHLLSHLFSE